MSRFWSISLTLTAKTQKTEGTFFLKVIWINSLVSCESFLCDVADSQLLIWCQVSCFVPRPLIFATSHCFHHPRRYQRLSFHESHHQRQLPGYHGNSPLQGCRLVEACVQMLRVTMETGARAYISILCVRLLHQGTFHHLINTQSVCSLLSKITAVSFQAAGCGACRLRRCHSQGQANFPAN